MILTTKGRYGLKAVFNIALNGPSPLSLRTISQREGISESYLEILMGMLKKGGILRSARGAYGGYMLSKQPKDITVGSVLTVLEGNIATAECVIDGLENQRYCNTENENCVRTCAIHGALKKLNDRIDSVLNSMTLQDMLDDQSEKEA